jgi:hypothetical protein
VTVPAALAQNGGCVLSPDPRNPDEKIMRCGTTLTIWPAADTVYHPVGGGPGRPPTAVKLDSGALLVDFHPTKARRNFQILTPQAIASVRGTKWAIEVAHEQTSTLVLRGAVEVARANAGKGVVLESGQGVDVASEGSTRGVDEPPTPLEVKHWAPERVKAMLALFGP